MRGERGESIFEGLDRYLGSLVDVPTVFAGKAVLEIGAGPGNYVKFITSRSNPRIVVGVDVAPRRLESCAMTTRVFSVGGDCGLLPFRDTCFDVAFGSLVLHVVSNIENTVAEIYRVLRPGGIYLGIEPSLLNPLHWWRYLTGRHFPGDHPVRARTFRRIFCEAGFDCTVRPLCPRWPAVAKVRFATCVGIDARKRPFAEAASAR